MKSVSMPHSNSCLIRCAAVYIDGPARKYLAHMKHLLGKVGWQSEEVYNNM